MNQAATPTTGRRGVGRLRFLQKVVAAAALIALADWLFFLESAGATAGLFALALLAALASTMAARRLCSAAAPFAAASLFALVLVEDPSWLALGLLWLATSLTVLLPRAAGFDDGWRWAGRLCHHLLRSLLAPVGDLRRLRAARARARQGRPRRAASLPNLWLPLLGSALFLALFAAANPLIGNAFADLDLAALLGGLSGTRILFWIALACLIWPLLRPRLANLAPTAAGDPDLRLPGVSLASITVSLLAFNALFALQNGLDLAFLWSGAALPQGMTLAEYAHRGAYPLIVTALLAALFVLVTLRPGSKLAASMTLRRLVYAWIAQNVLLVASTILRTLDYVDAYSLTRLRIAALLWMGLVAIGLISICWRIWRDKKGAWLINVNLAAALLVLSLCSVVDLGATAAAWNLRHAREVGGHGSSLDLCYLNDLDSSALLSLIALESRPLPPALRDRIAWTRNLLTDRLEQRQADWHAWTFRDARRLAQAQHLVALRHLPRFTAGRRQCDGAPYPPPPPPAPVPPPSAAPAKPPTAPLPTTPLPATPLTASPER